MRGEGRGVGPLDDEEHAGTVASHHSLSQGGQVTTAAQRGRIGEEGHAILHQGDRLRLQPATPVPAFQQEIEAAFAPARFPVDNGIASERRQAPSQQRLMDQRVGQPGIHGNQRALMLDEQQVIASATLRTMSRPQPHPPTGDQQLS